MSGSKSEELQAIRIMLEEMDIFGGEKETIIKKFKDSDKLKIDNLDNARFQALFSELKINSLIKFLSLKNNKIGADGAKVLAEALKSNTTLTSLNLGLNNIGDAGARDLAEALKVNTILASLDLSLNKIGNDGARDLAEILKGNITLTSLDLFDNHTEGAGARVIAEAIKYSLITSCKGIPEAKEAANANKTRLEKAVSYLKSKFVNYDFGDQSLENVETTKVGEKKYISIIPDFDSFREQSEDGKVDFGGNLFKFIIFKNSDQKLVQQYLDAALEIDLSQLDADSKRSAKAVGIRLMQQATEEFEVANFCKLNLIGKAVESSFVATRVLQIEGDSGGDQQKSETIKLNPYCMRHIVLQLGDDWPRNTDTKSEFSFNDDSNYVTLTGELDEAVELGGN